MPITIVAFAALLLAVPLFANDSSSYISIGGLTLNSNEDVSMDGEDLYISQEKVQVKYRFTNNSDKDVELLVSFPLPAIPGGIDGYLGDQNYPDWKDFEFTTLVNGKPVTLSRVDQIEINGRPGSDISARLAKLGWPTQYWGDGDYDNMEEYAFQKMLEKYSKGELDAFVAEGLLRWQDDEKGYINPNWSQVTYVTRKQTFPARQTITVEHSYRPIAGGSVGGSLLPKYRKDGDFKESYAHYCIDKNFLAGFDAKMAEQAAISKRKGEESYGAHSETWIGYVLKSGANWKGPIKDFRLVVDKGDPLNLVSFCMDGVKKISPTQFEVRKTNFEPTKDLDILIINIPDPKDL